MIDPITKRMQQVFEDLEMVPQVSMRDNVDAALADATALVGTLSHVISELKAEHPDDAKQALQDAATLIGKLSASVARATTSRI